MSENDWLVAGGEAVILQPWGRGALRAESVTIERVMKRDVVLSNGDRFPVAHLQRQRGGSYGVTEYLVSPKDPKVAQTRMAIRDGNLRFRATASFESWRRGKATAAEVAEAFNKLASTQRESRPGSESEAGL